MDKDNKENEKEIIVKKEAVTEDALKTSDKQDKQTNAATELDFSFSDAPAPVKKGASSTQKTSRSFKAKKKKNKRPKQVSQGRAYIKSTYNNTLVTLTDQNGNVIAWSSAGISGFRGAKKATPYAAGVIVKDAVEKARLHGLKEVIVFVKGVGMAREAAIRALNANGINVISIKDTTPIPHNGCRQKKPRRV